MCYNTLTLESFHFLRAITRPIVFQLRLQLNHNRITLGNDHSTDALAQVNTQRNTLRQRDVRRWRRECVRSTIERARTITAQGSLGDTDRAATHGFPLVVFATKNYNTCSSHFKVTSYALKTLIIIADSDRIIWWKFVLRKFISFSTRIISFFFFFFKKTNDYRRWSWLIDFCVDLKINGFKKIIIMLKLIIK